MAKKRALVEEDEEGNESPAEEVVTKAVFDETGHRTREILVSAPVLTDGQTSLKIVSWNVNGLRSLATTNKATLLNLIKEQTPDILCLQETKIQDNTIGDYDNLLEGYESYWNCSTDKKGYSGTAVFLKKDTITINPSSKRSGSGPICAAPPKKQAKLSAFFKKGLAEPVISEEELSQEAVVSSPTAPVSVVQQVSYDFEDEGKRFNGEGRTITVEFDNFILVACYVPNSGEDLKRLNYRIDEWEPHMRQYLKKLSARKPVVYTGDLNCGHLDIDIHNPTAKHIPKQSGLTVVERAAFDQMLQETQFRDAFRHFHPDAKGQFTYWSVRAGNRPWNKGIRLDYFICSPDMFPRVEGEAAVGKEAAAVAEAENSRMRVLVHDSYILHKETVGCSDHCPVVLVVKL